MGNTTSIHNAAMDGDLTTLRVAVQKHPSELDVQESENGWTALHIACAKGYDAIVRELLARGSAPNGADKKGRTPLHLAASQGHTHVMKDLLKKGADPERKDNERKTPMDYAIEKQCAPAIALLHEVLNGTWTPGTPPGAPGSPSRRPFQQQQNQQQQYQQRYQQQYRQQYQQRYQQQDAGGIMEAAPHNPQQYQQPQQAPAPAGAAGPGPYGYPEVPPPLDNWLQQLPLPPGQENAPAPSAPAAPSAPPAQPWQQPPGGAFGYQGYMTPDGHPAVATPGIGPGSHPVMDTAGSMQPSSGGPGEGEDDWEESPVGDWGDEEEPRPSRSTRLPSAAAPPAPQVRPQHLPPQASRPPQAQAPRPEYQQQQQPSTATSDATERMQHMNIGQAVLGAGLAAAGRLLGGLVNPQPNRQQQQQQSEGQGVDARPARQRWPAPGARPLVVDTANATATGPSGRRYTYEQLYRATQGFAPSNCIGSGGYGTVYKGILDGTPVAIKALDQGVDAMQGLKEFQAEVQILTRLHHPHIVLLIGSCPDGCMLVYELMDNSTLDVHLFSPAKPDLHWQDRVRIAAEVASALVFLHSAPEPIIHMVGDVGLSRLAPTLGIGNGDRLPQVSTVQDTRLVGTPTYMDPEYLRTGRFSAKSDVYSLGVIMLQLVTGIESSNIVGVAESALARARTHPEALEAIIDRRAGNWPMSEAAPMAHMAARCVAMSRSERPDLRNEVLPVLLQLAERAQLFPLNAPVQQGRTSRESGLDACVICLSADRQVGLLHGDSVHKCVCTECASLLSRGMPCPMCRAPIERIMQVW